MGQSLTLSAASASASTSDTVSKNNFTSKPHFAQPKTSSSLTELETVAGGYPSVASRIKFERSNVRSFNPKLFSHTLSVPQGQSSSLSTLPSSILRTSILEPRPLYSTSSYYSYNTKLYTSKPIAKSSLSDDDPIITDVKIPNKDIYREKKEPKRYQTISDTSGKFLDTPSNPAVLAARESRNVISQIDSYLSNPDKRLPTSAQTFKHVYSSSQYTDTWAKEEAMKLEKLIKNANDAARSNGITTSQLSQEASNIYNTQFYSSNSQNQSYKPFTPDATHLQDVSGRFSNIQRYTKQLFKRPVIRPKITDQMMREIKAAFLSPDNKELVNAFNIPITCKDLQTLCGLNWLNDEIINFYMQLIVERSKNDDVTKSDKKNPSVYAFNTFFYSKLRESGHSALKRWTPRVDIFSYDCLIVPVHLGNHWCLAFIDIENKCLSYYDSMGGGSHGCLDVLVEYLREESLDKKKCELNLEGWNLNKRHEDIPQQTNGSDCGVFTCVYAEYLSRRAEFDFSQADMPYFRHKMMYEIIHKRLLTFKQM